MNSIIQKILRNGLKLNCSNLKEDEQKELIEAHSEGIKFMAVDTTTPQPASISWFRQKYDILWNIQLQ